MTTSWKAIIGVILIFVLGLFCGVALTSIIAHRMVMKALSHPGQAIVTALEKRLTGNLRLDPDQRTKIHDLFMQNLQRRQELQRQIQPDVQALNRETFQQINAIIPPDQLDRFHENVNDLRKKFGQGTLNAEQMNPEPPAAASPFPPPPPRPR